MTDITELLSRWRAGDQDIENALLREIYPVLRDLARARLRRESGALTLRATELANEAYLKLCQVRGTTWNNRGHFYAVAAKAIRNFVIDYVRTRDADKRGGGLPFVPLDALDERVGSEVISLDVDWLAVHAALQELEAEDPASATVVELKFFSGMTNEEIADATGVSRATVVRQWRFARAWMATRLGAPS